MNPQSSNRDGFALALVVVVLVVISALTAGAAFSASQEHTASRNSMWEEQALSAAEYGFNRTLETWSSTTMGALTYGSVAERVDTTYNGVVVRTRITRTDAQNYMLVAEAFAGPSPTRLTRRRVSTVIHTTSMVPARAAVMSRGPWTLSGFNTSDPIGIDGRDSSPDGWTACNPGDTVPGLMEPDTSHPSWGNGRAAGAPPVLQTSFAADSMNYFRMPGLDWDALKAQAIAGGQYWTSNASSIRPYAAADGSCDRSMKPNWGEPWRPTTSGLSGGQLSSILPACYDYYPVIFMDVGGPGHAVSFSSGRGQGILVVNGDLTISGASTFAGLIIVRGKTVLSGGGNKVYGALMSWDAALAAHTESGSSHLMYSTCALNSALGQAGQRKPVLLKHRAWSDMF